MAKPSKPLIDPKVAYAQAMGLKRTRLDNPNDALVNAALQRAHEIRKFEIDLYWKRSNYFWLLQAAVLAAFGVVLGSGNKPVAAPVLYDNAILNLDMLGQSTSGGSMQLLPLALACLGLICAFAGWLSAKGSKFWQKNWEKHIDCLEDAFEGRLHKTVWIGENGISHSVSRVNSDLILCFGLFWLGAVVWQGYAQIEWGQLCFQPSDVCQRDPGTALAFIFLAITLGAVWRLQTRWTNFEHESRYKKRKRDSLWIRFRLFWKRGSVIRRTTRIICMTVKNVVAIIYQPRHGQNRWHERGQITGNRYT